MIIGLTGLAGSGKTTAADYLCKEYGFIKVNFKDALIEELKLRFPDLLKLFANWEGMLRLCDEGQYTIDRLFIDKPAVVRALMQNYGTEVRRADDPHYWVNRWSEQVYRLGEHQDIVVDDVRFMNEADQIKMMGGKVLRLERPDLTEPMQHVSEIEGSMIDHDMAFCVEKGKHQEIYNMLDLYLKEINEGERQEDGVHNRQGDSE